MAKQTNKTGIQIAKEVIGKALKDVRKAKGITTYTMLKSHGLRYEQIKAIEEGSTAYTIDVFLLYISALNVYFFLEDKDGDAHLSSIERLKKMMGDEGDPEILKN